MAHPTSNAPDYTPDVTMVGSSSSAAAASSSVDAQLGYLSVDMTPFIEEQERNRIEHAARNALIRASSAAMQIDRTSPRNPSHSPSRTTLIPEAFLNCGDGSLSAILCMYYDDDTIEELLNDLKNSPKQASNILSNAIKQGRLQDITSFASEALKFLEPLSVDTTKIRTLIEKTKSFDEVITTICKQRSLGAMRLFAHSLQSELSLAFSMLDPDAYIDFEKPTNLSERAPIKLPQYFENLWKNANLIRQVRPLLEQDLPTLPETITNKEGEEIEVDDTVILEMFLEGNDINFSLKILNAIDFSAIEYDDMDRLPNILGRFVKVIGPEACQDIIQTQYTSAEDGAQFWENNRPILQEAVAQYVVESIFKKSFFREDLVPLAIDMLEQLKQSSQKGFSRSVTYAIESWRVEFLPPFHAVSNSSTATRSIPLSLNENQLINRGKEIVIACLKEHLKRGATGSVGAEALISIIFTSEKWRAILSKIVDEIVKSSSNEEVDFYISKLIDGLDNLDSLLKGENGNEGVDHWEISMFDLPDGYKGSEEWPSRENDFYKQFFISAKKADNKALAQKTLLSLYRKDNSYSQFEHFTRSALDRHAFLDAYLLLKQIPRVFEVYASSLAYFETAIERAAPEELKELTVYLERALSNIEIIADDWLSLETAKDELAAILTVFYRISISDHNARFFAWLAAKLIAVGRNNDAQYIFNKTPDTNKSLLAEMIFAAYMNQRNLEAAESFVKYLPENGTRINRSRAYMILSVMYQKTNTDKAKELASLCTNSEDRELAVRYRADQNNITANLAQRQKNRT